ncbi:hypothetical protein NC651_014621 [Populus alba x Populus x berolinensis]|nr:hypothetical protein NC651_014621 [Populus alba x Populus x berolinensis]
MALFYKVQSFHMVLSRFNTKKSGGFLTIIFPNCESKQAYRAPSI